MPGFYVADLTGKCEGFSEIPSQYLGPSNTVETARKNRYRISNIIAGGEGTQPTTSLAKFALYAYKCTRPGTKYDIITIHNGFDQITRPGKVTYTEVTFSFYEVVDQTTAQNDPATHGTGNVANGPANHSVAMHIRDWHAKAMYVRRYSMLRRPDDYLATIQLDVLDGTGSPTYTYLMYGCWPSEITPSDLSYADGDIADITVKLQVNKFLERHSSEQPG